MAEDHTFTLPKEPWTYGNGAFNPDLHPSPYEHLSRPPYADEGENEDDDHYDDRTQNRQFIRRGSEGYEVRPINREAMMRQYIGSQPHLTEFARAQERAVLGDEGDNYGVSDEGEGDNKLEDEEEMEREVMDRVGEAGRYRPYVPERWESDDEEDDAAVEQIPNGLPVHD
jgi:hypothetical protein